MRLIDADALLKNVEDKYPTDNYEFQEMIKDAPTINRENEICKPDINIMLRAAEYEFIRNEVIYENDQYQILFDGIDWEKKRCRVMIVRAGGGTMYALADIDVFNRIIRIKDSKEQGIVDFLVLEEIKFDKEI